MHIKKEEYTAIADFIRKSFERDQSAITVRYPKLNAAFLTAFSAKLEHVKKLESAAVTTKHQKKATQELYAEADALNDELTFLIDYFKDAGLETTVISKLKEDLWRNNIEGAVLKIESVMQLIESDQEALVEEGMASDFTATLAAHKVSLSDKNQLQNQHINAGRSITENNKGAYESLYDDILKIANAGKKVLKGTVAEDEYSVTKIIRRMRAAGGPKEE
jgi:hypothetical protein